MFKFFFTFTMALFLTTSYSQFSQIVGQVIDAETSGPLIGASVRIVGDSSLGVVTDIDGRFILDAEDPEVELEFSYLGYSNLRQLCIAKAEVLRVLLQPTTTILETTTITGSRYQKSLAKSAVSINVIKPELIQNSNTSIIDQLLDKVPGVQMIGGQANIRGGSGFSYGAGSRVLLLIDDVPAFQADAGRPLWDDIPVENIAQIEILKGAASALYGSSALNGIINIRTGYATSTPQTSAFTSYTHYMPPADEEKKWWGQDTTISSPYRYNVGVTHKQKFGKLDLVAAGFAEKVEDFRQGSYKDRLRTSLNLKYRFNSRVALSINGMYNYKDSESFFVWENARSGAYKGGPGTSTGGVTNRFYIDPQLTIFNKNGDKHRLISRYYYLNNGSIGNQATKSDNLFFEYQYTGKLSKYDVNYTTGTSAYLIRSNSELYGSVDIASNNYAVFGQLDKAFLSNKLELTIGGRFEKNTQDTPVEFISDTIPANTDESRFVKRLGLNYTLSRAIHLRYSYGEGYRFPTIAERFLRTNLGGVLVLPNPTLKSETGYTTEFGVKSLFKVGSWEGYADLALFASEYKNMMEFTFGQVTNPLNGERSSGFQSLNVGNTSITGLEINLVGRSKLGKHTLNLLAGYTFIIPTYKDFDTNPSIYETISTPIDDAQDPNFLKYRSKHNFKIDAEVSFRKLMLGTSFNVTSALITLDQFLSLYNEIGLYRQANGGGYYKWDARVSYDLDFLKVSLLTENITNREFTIRPGVLEAPRNISLRLDKRF